MYLVIIFVHRPTVFGFGQSADDRPIVCRQSADDRLICRPILYSLIPLSLADVWADRRPPQRQSCLRNGTRRLVTLLISAGKFGPPLDFPGMRGTGGRDPPGMGLNDPKF